VVSRRPRRSDEHDDGTSETIGENSTGLTGALFPVDDAGTATSVQLGSHDQTHPRVGRAGNAVVGRVCTREPGPS
jgi:hypothetical protein